MGCRITLVDLHLILRITNLIFNQMEKNIPENRDEVVEWVSKNQNEA